MQLVRSVLSDPALSYHLFACYDLNGERKLDAVQVRRLRGGSRGAARLLPGAAAAAASAAGRLMVQPAACSRLANALCCPHRLQALCQAAGDVIESMLSAAASRDLEDEPQLEVVASLYSDKTAGGCWWPGQGGCVAGPAKAAACESSGAGLSPAD